MTVSMVFESFSGKRAGAALLIAFILTLCNRGPCHAADMERRVTFDFQSLSMDAAAQAFSRALGESVTADSAIRSTFVDFYVREITLREAMDRFSAKYNLRFARNDKGYVLESVGKPVSVLNFRDTPLGDVARVFTELSGKNVVANSDIMKKPITFFMKDVPPKVAIESLCKQNGFWYREDPYYIRIMKLDDYARDMSFSYEGEIRTITLRNAPAAMVADTIANLMEDRVVIALPEMDDSYGHVGYGAEDTGSFTVEEPEEGGGGGGGGGGETILEGEEVPKYKKGELSAEQIGRLMEYAKREERKRAEAEAETGEAKGEVGPEDILIAKKQIPRAYITVFGRDNTIILYSADRGLLNQIEEMVAKLDTPAKQVLLEGKILQISLGDDFQSVFDWDYAHERTIKGKSVELESTLSQLDATTMIYSFVDDYFALRLQMLRQENRVKTVGTPMVLAANNSLADFFVGKKRLIVTSWGPKTVGTRSLGEGVYEDIVRVLPAYVEQQVGTRLEIIPFVNEEGLVTLRVKMQNEDVQDDAYNIEVPDDTGQVARFSIDAVVSSVVQDTLVVKDGQTVAIGGLVQETKSVGEAKVPLLGDVPILGFFFKRKTKALAKTETILLLTPHVISKATMGGDVTADTMEKLSSHPVARGDDKRILDYDPDTRQIRSRDEPTTNPAEYLLDGSERRYYKSGMRPAEPGRPRESILDPKTGDSGGEGDTCAEPEAVDGGDGLLTPPAEDRYED